MSDIRKQRSIKHIDTAIYDLLGQMSFADITVTKICQQAELGRSTFYQYYFDKYEWLQKQVAYYEQILQKSLDQRFAHHNLSEELNSLMNDLWPNHDRLVLLFDVHTPEADLTTSFEKLLVQHFINSVPKKDFDAEEFSFLSTLYGSVAATNIKWSMKHGISKKINEMMDESLKGLMVHH